MVSLIFSSLSYDLMTKYVNIDCNNMIVLRQRLTDDFEGHLNLLI